MMTTSYILDHGDMDQCRAEAADMTGRVWRGADPRSSQYTVTLYQGFRYVTGECVTGIGAAREAYRRLLNAGQGDNIKVTRVACGR